MEALRVVCCLSLTSLALWVNSKCSTLIWTYAGHWGVKGKCRMIGLHSSDNSPSSNCLELMVSVLRGVEDLNLMVLTEGLGSWSGER